MYVKNIRNIKFNDQIFKIHIKYIYIYIYIKLKFEEFIFRLI